MHNHVLITKSKFSQYYSTMVGSMLSKLLGFVKKKVEIFCHQNLVFIKKMGIR